MSVFELDFERRIRSIVSEMKLVVLIAPYAA